MRNKVLWLFVLCGFLMVAVGVNADDWRTNPKDAKEWESYNKRSNSHFSDYDNDGIPNRIDTFDNDKYKNPKFRDYDNDGVPNNVDPYDNKHWVPKGKRRR